MHFVHESRTVTSFVRIIAGEFRGRRLLGPADQATRPITDRVKQSLFDILSQQLPGAAVWDVFSGTGSLGLEALSRGAASSTFFERHRPASVRLQRNIDALGLAGRCRIISRDVLALRSPELNELPPPDLIFFDPPYPLLRDRPSELSAALQCFAGRLGPGGRAILRMEKGASWTTDLPLLDDRSWGSMRILFLGSPGSPQQR